MLENNVEKEWLWGSFAYYFFSPADMYCILTVSQHCLGTMGETIKKIIKVPTVL